jgi:hypothetical protein
MTTLLPLVLALFLSGGAPSSELGFDTQRLDTTNVTVQGDDADTSTQTCTTLCPGTNDN